MGHVVCAATWLALPAASTAGRCTCEILGTMATSASTKSAMTSIERNMLGKLPSEYRLAGAAGAAAGSTTGPTTGPTGAAPGDGGWAALSDAGVDRVDGVLMLPSSPTSAPPPKPACAPRQAGADSFCADGGPLMKQSQPDRTLALELGRVTEAAAMAGGRWVGRG